MGGKSMSEQKKENDYITIDEIRKNHSHHDRCDGYYRPRYHVYIRRLLAEVDSQLAEIEILNQKNKEGIA